MIDNFAFKDNYKIDDLVNIVAILRGEGGCPWDREQTHTSLKKDLIEECYEVIEAINKENPEMLCEELGDVLLQVVMHSQIGKEEGSLDFDAVCDGVCKKMIVRHPHVFGDVTANTTAEVLANWDDIKRKTKSQKSTTEAMDSVPRELPALMRAEKIQKKARKAGFDFENLNQTIDKIHEEADELIKAESAEDKFEELGDLLFACVNAARFTDVDPEEALTRATDKFFARFAYVEKLAAERGIDMKASSLEVLDALWDEAKINQKSKKGE